MYRAPFFRGQFFTVGDLWPEAEDMPDITDTVNGMLFGAIPADRHDFISIGIVADPGGGKTQLAVYLAKRVYDLYGAENMTIIYCRDVNEGLKKMDGRPIQFLIVDDASGSQNSRTAYENIDAIQNVLTARHTAKQRQDGAAGPQGGIVFLVWSWQYYTTLERVFRKVHYAFLKTYEDETHHDYKRLLGGYGDALRLNTLDIRKGVQEAKNYSLCAVPAMFQDGNRYAGRGVYRSALVDRFPAFPDTSLVHKAVADPVSDLLKDVDPEKLFKAREIAYMLTKKITDPVTGKDRRITQAEAGKAWNMEQADVSRLLAWYRKCGGIIDTQTKE